MSIQHARDSKTEARTLDALDELLTRNYGDTLHFTVKRLVSTSLVEFQTSRNHVSRALSRLSERDDCPVVVSEVGGDGSDTRQRSWTATRRGGGGEV